MTRASLLAHLKRIGACPRSIAWVKRTKGTPSELWAKCKRPEWRHWLCVEAQCPCKQCWSARVANGVTTSQELVDLYNEGLRCDGDWSSVPWSVVARALPLMRTV